MKPPPPFLLEKDVSESVSYYAEVIEKHRAEVQAALADHRPDVFYRPRSGLSNSWGKTAL